MQIDPLDLSSVSNIGNDAERICKIIRRVQCLSVRADAEACRVNGSDLVVIVRRRSVLRKGRDVYERGLEGRLGLVGRCQRELSFRVESEDPDLVFKTTRNI